jgi:hypothetical protein
MKLKQKTDMEFTSKAAAKRLTGLTYLGGYNKSVKHRKAKKYNELTYALYLAPAKTSGYEVCPGRTAECAKLCLNESGMNSMVRNDRGEVINDSRIIKTKLFFEHRDFFMKWLIFEINAGITKAKKLGFAFSVRLNNTSDISPEDFQLDGKNILEIFPDVQFYDYSKLTSRAELMKKYPNYDLTYSYNGYNLPECKTMLENMIKVAVVFKVVPLTFMGYPVIDGDLNDLRYRDEPTVIGLQYKRTRNPLPADAKFVIQ